MIFENPAIVKIFHGAINGGGQGDLGWLQRDFGILCCNVFDDQEFYRLIYQDPSKKKKK